MVDNPKNKLFEIAQSAGRTPANILADLLDGTEMALLEVLLYLHDKKLIDKDELAVRLSSNASNIERTFNGNGLKQDVSTLAFPSRRLATALLSAVTEPEKDAKE
ncbi:hypothetical protein [Bordetella genomosp. 4]|uniref:Uncharacterized protein n=1 Tax=Bordetella genomosp. 4 TaxID=463044 RepID=A0A261U7S4_9BORD|nr:hypothetical protein [Bordetella genomosp. 4]OZI57641.1 hypothetical protein CAL20_09705 [Bordetella genomosp. 4]